MLMHIMINTPCFYHASQISKHVHIFSISPRLALKLLSHGHEILIFSLQKYPQSCLQNIRAEIV